MNKNHIQKSIVFVIIGLLFLPLMASAAPDILGGIVNALGINLDDMANSILSAFFGLIASLVAGIPAAALSFLNWVAGPDFLQISMTNSGLSLGDPRYNTLVGTGWEITRNLANVALIFGLVVIAINIILGSQEVQAKKSLINFVLIAILINFTPVICGLIIDASNSLTYYFMQEGVRGDLVNFLKQSIQENHNMDSVALIVFFFFGIFSAVIYLLYALLFAARYIILWILIILSPIAFASKVFPKSRYITKVFPSFCYWDEWWDQFIQWNVIGIPAGFFIYLSNVAMVELTAGGVFADSSGISVFGQLFSYAMPFIFMVIGFFTTMSSGGAVGAKISGVAKNIGGKAKTAIVAGGTGAALGFASGANAGYKSEARLGTLRGAFKGAAQGALTGGEAEKGEVKRWVQRKIKEPLGLSPLGKADAEEEKLIKEGIENMKKIDKEKRLSIAKSKPTTAPGMRQKLEAIGASIDERDLDDETMEWVANEKNKEMLKGWNFNFKNAAKYAPEYSEKLTGKTTQATINSMSPKEAREKIRIKSYEDIGVRAALSDDKYLKNIKDFGTREQNDALEDTTLFSNLTLEHIIKVDDKNLKNLGKNMTHGQRNALNENDALKKEFKEMKKAKDYVASELPIQSSKMNKPMEEHFKKVEKKLQIILNERLKKDSDIDISQELK